MNGGLDGARPPLSQYDVLELFSSPWHGDRSLRQLLPGRDFLVVIFLVVIVCRLRPAPPTRSEQRRNQRTTHAPHLANGCVTIGGPNE